jgi:allantoate deiminase
MTPLEYADNAVRHCRMLATFSEDADRTTRTFLSPPMRQVHAYLSEWMEATGMTVSLDAAGNLRGVYAAVAPTPPARRLYIASHLDTVRRAGAFDGVLGVVLAITLVEMLDGIRLPFAIETIGFSEEEGVRFGVPFIGSRALIGTLDASVLDRTDSDGISVRDAIARFGLDPRDIPHARAADDALGYLEFHIEQGPVLEQLNRSTAIVDGIVGQNRSLLTFTGMANHAGTTPMHLRQDALAAAAEWIVAVERSASATTGVVATVGRIDVEPNVGNVIADRCRVSLDLRSLDDTVRRAEFHRLIAASHDIAARRGVAVQHEALLDQPSVPMNAELRARLDRATAEVTGHPAHHMASGAGHDAMIVADRMPAAMLFVRSPGGISHHPDESVLVPDVAAALSIGRAFLEDLARG